MPYSAEQLISIARQYWRADRKYDNAAEFSPEHERISRRWDEELERVDWWHAFSAELRKSLPDLSIGNNPATCDTSWKYLAYDTAGCAPSAYRFVVAGCVSILAPVYAIYGVQYDFGEFHELEVDGFRYRVRKRLNPRMSLMPLPPEMREVGEIMASKIEAYFGAEMLPREILETPVPLIANFKEPPQTNLMHVLFTHEPDALP